MLLRFIVALFVLALAFLILAQGHEAAAVLNAFAAQSFVAKLAWIIVVLVPFALVPGAVFLGETLLRQRQAALALEARLDGMGRASTVSQGRSLKRKTRCIISPAPIRKIR